MMNTEKQVEKSEGNLKSKSSSKLNEYNEAKKIEDGKKQIGKYKKSEECKKMRSLKGYVILFVGEHCEKVEEVKTEDA